MGMGRTALELRVGLGGHEERVAAALQLDELHQGAVGRGTADVQPGGLETCLLYTSPSPRDATLSRMPSSA